MAGHSRPKDGVASLAYVPAMTWGGAGLPNNLVSGMNPPMTTPPAPEADTDPLAQALALHRQGKHDLAMQRYVAILQREPNNADALYYVAVLAIQEGQIAEGIKVIGRALDVG